MNFKYDNTIDIQKKAIFILKKLGHKFNENWHSVRFSNNIGEECLDALSIYCASPDCKMRFDINAAELSGGNSVKVMKFLLWYGCKGIAEFRYNIVLNDYDAINNELIHHQCMCEDGNTKPFL